MCQHKHTYRRARIYRKLMVNGITGHHIKSFTFKMTTKIAYYMHNNKNDGQLRKMEIEREKGKKNSNNTTDFDHSKIKPSAAEHSNHKSFE